jgi:hypothetical protein
MGTRSERWPVGITDKFDRHWIPEPNSGCWLWMGAHNELGYGLIRREGKTVKAHRFAYEREKGKIPDGLALDHLCRNPCCVNPCHLEAVTHAENQRRANQARTFTDLVVSCVECGAEIARKYAATEPQRCRRCIHRSAQRTYYEKNGTSYYWRNKEHVLRRMKEKYQQKKELCNVISE